MQTTRMQTTELQVNLLDAVCINLVVSPTPLFDIVINETRIIVRITMEMLSEARTSVIGINISYKENSDELKKRLDILRSLKDDINAECAKQRQIKKDIAAVERKMYILLDDVMVKEKTCLKQQKDVQKITKQNAELNLELSKLTRDIEQEKKIIGEYHKKIELSHQSNVEYEEQCAGNGDIMQLMQQLSSLQLQKEEIDIRSGEVNQQQWQVKLELNDIEKEFATLMKATEKTNTMLEEMSNQERGKKQRIAVLHKRNEAQLTRLQKQITEFSKPGHISAK